MSLIREETKLVFIPGFSLNMLSPVVPAFGFFVGFCLIFFIPNGNEAGIIIFFLSLLSYLYSCKVKMIVELDSKFLTIKKKFFGKESIVLIDLKEISKIDETLIYKDLRIITSNGKVFKIYGGIAPKNPINFKLASNVLPNRVGLYILKAKLNKLLENSLSK